MEPKKQEETTPVSTDAVSNEVMEVETAQSSTEYVSSSMENETQGEIESETKAPFKGMTYVIAAVIIIVIGLGLLFVLERDGRVATGVFSGITENMQANLPSAKVNGVVIPKSEFDSGVRQLMEVARSQGANVEDPQLLSQFNTQAIETLVNGELLRQAATKKDLSVSAEDINTRYDEIVAGVGGLEVLQQRMAEFGIDEENLRHDIENEILIQGLFDIVIKKDDSEVSEEEVLTFYNQAGGEEAGLPPLDDVRAQIEEQIVIGREQEQIGAYLEELRKDANVEILI